jgi:hypothetical protein
VAEKGGKSAVPRRKVTATFQKVTATFVKVTVTFPKVAATFPKVTATFAEVTVTFGKGTAGFGRDGVPRRPPARAFPSPAGRVSRFRWPKNWEAPAGTAQRAIPTGKET